MKKIKKLLFMPILLSPIITMISCSSNQINNNSDYSSNSEISENLTKEQVLYINSNNARKYIEKFPNLLSNDGTLDLSIFMNLISINENAFVGIENIKRIIFNEKITQIKDGAFKNINSLIELDIPSSLEKIGQNAFNNAFSNKEVIINFNNNEKINEIGTNAFIGKNLKISVHNDVIKSKIISSNFDTNNIISDLSPIGGYFSGLTVDKYLTIISSLKINNATSLSMLNDEKLNNELKNEFPQKNYSVTILKESSEHQGILNLGLKLSTNSNQINLKISGFDSFKKSEVYIINNVSLNSNKWFKNIQSEESIKNWTNENWKTYLSTLKVSDFDLKNSYDLLDIKDNINYQIKYENKKISITLQTNYKKYNGTHWIEEISEMFYIGGKGSGSYDIKLPNKNDLYNFIKNILEINEANRNNYIDDKYASYYLHLSKSTSNDTLNNIIKIPNNYLDYIKQNLNINDMDRISIRFNEIYPNDTSGILRFSYDFVDASNNSTLFTGIYLIDGFKKIYQEMSVNMQIIKQDGSLFNTYLRLIKNEKQKEVLNNMQENQSLSLKNFGFLGKGNPNEFNLLHDEQNENKNQVEFDWLNRSFLLLLNNSYLDENSIDFKTNYFSDPKNLDNSGYIVKYLYISTDVKKDAKITKSNNVWTYSFQITVSLGIWNSEDFLSNTSLDIKLDSNCTMTINKNDINNQNNLI